MCSGTLTFEVDISTDNEDKAIALASSIKASVRNLAGVNSIEEVDSDLEDDGED